MSEYASTASPPRALRSVSSLSGCQRSSWSDRATSSASRGTSPSARSNSRAGSSVIPAWCADTLPAVVDRETWDRVQAKLARVDGPQPTNESSQ